MLAQVLPLEWEFHLDFTSQQIRETEIRSHYQFHQDLIGPLVSVYNEALIKQIITSRFFISLSLYQTPA